MTLVPALPKSPAKPAIDAYAAWMKKVNAAVLAKCGMTADDLPDVCYSDMYADGVTPKAAAAKAIKNAQCY